MKHTQEEVIQEVLHLNKEEHKSDFAHPIDVKLKTFRFNAELIIYHTIKHMK